MGWTHYGDGGNNVLRGIHNIKFEFFNSMGGHDRVLAGPGPARVHLGDGDDYVSGRGRLEAFGGAGDDHFDFDRAASSSIAWLGTDLGVGHDTVASRSGDVDTVDLNPNARQIVNLEGMKHDQIAIINNVNVETKHIILKGSVFDLVVEDMTFAREGKKWFLDRAVFDSKQGPEIRLEFDEPDGSPFSNPVWRYKPDWRTDKSLDPDYIDSFQGEDVFDLLFI